MAESNGSEAVADALWDRVRHLARTVDALAELDATGELDVDGQARLDRARLRLRKAVDRAQMADTVSDQLAAARSAQTRAGRGA
jgi:hypothetical protein